MYNHEGHCTLLQLLRCCIFLRQSLRRKIGAQLSTLKMFEEVTGHLERCFNFISIKMKKSSLMPNFVYRQIRIAFDCKKKQFD